MLRVLQFNMSVPTPYVFLNRYYKAAQADEHVCKPHLIHVYMVFIACTKKFAYPKSSFSIASYAVFLWDH